VVNVASALRCTSCEDIFTLLIISAVASLACCGMDHSLCGVMLRTTSVLLARVEDGGAGIVDDDECAFLGAGGSLLISRQDYIVSGQYTLTWVRAAVVHFVVCIFRSVFCFLLRRHVGPYLSRVFPWKASQRKIQRSHYATKAQVNQGHHNG
jgi:hypothetical protein